MGLDLFCYGEVGSFECRGEEVKAILQVISSNSPHSTPTAAKLQDMASSATVHAEAALLGYAYFGSSNKIFSPVSKFMPTVDAL
jgi:hypothetical protein